MNVEFHFLGLIDFDLCLTLQRQLALEATADAGRIVVLCAEHPNLITVGRSGSRAHIRLSDEELRQRRLEVKWVRRGGGAVLHSPGQLALYPIVPLRWCGWSANEYLGRLQQAVVGVCHDLQIHPQTHPSSFSLRGRNGGLMAVGIAVRNGVAFHGAFLNVAPTMTCYHFIDSLAGAVPRGEKPTLSSLLAERQQSIRMPAIRSALVGQLATAFAADRYHLHTGHPYLVRKRAHS